MNLLRGSQWQRWDLHIHTKGTAKNDQFNSSATFEDFCVTLFKKALENNIVAIGITDYFNIENYRKVEQFRARIDSFSNINSDGSLIFSSEDKEKIKEIFILPNIELRMMPSTDSGRLVNIHCLFNPDFVADIENDFFGSIEYSGGTGRKYKMNREGITSLGKSLDGTLNDEEAYKKGLKTFVVSHADLQKLYDERIPFRENVIIAVSNSNNDGASAFQQHYDLFENDAESQLDAVRKSIYCISHAVFTSNLQDRKYFLGQKADDEETVIRKCGSLKPCIHGSDAHTEDKLFKPDNNMFCWIQADPTFEGLKQVIWDPKERVRIQERNPGDTKSGRTVIDFITYTDSNGNEKKVYLNPDLNSIIGVRGSGKSTLLKNIAFKIDSAQFGEKDKTDRLYSLANFKVTWGDTQTNSGSDQSPKSIFYIPQNYLSSLAYDEGDKAKERDDFLTSLLKKHLRFANAIQTYEEFVSNNKIKIEGLIESLLQGHKSLTEAETQIKKQGSKQEIEKEIKGKNEEIIKYKGSGDQSITTEEVTKYTQAKNIVAEGEKNIVRLNQDKEILNSLNQTGANIFIASPEFSRLSIKIQESIKSELIKKGKENLNILIQSELSNVSLEIDRLQKVIEENKKVIAELDKKITTNKAIETLTKELGELQQILRKIDDLSNQVVQMKSQKEEAISGLIEAYTDLESRQKSIFNTVQFEDTFSFLKIEIVMEYSTDDLKRFVERNINTRDTDPNLKQDQDISALFSEFPQKPSAEAIQKIIINLIDGKIITKVDANDIGQVISQLLKNRYEIDYLNSVKTKDESTHFKDMTGGQKAIALLELVFKFDDEKYPILIDQPEDDLDVGGVATDLVDFIKREKSERQIIIVSHNASLVICADTEEIIASRNTKIRQGVYDFSYQTGAIENVEIREQIIKVLEGGREALLQRARKLDFKHQI